MKFMGVGDNVCDVYLHEKTMYPGGQALNLSVYMRRLGAESAYFGLFGNDGVARHVCEALDAEGVDRSRCRVADAPNGYAMVDLVDGDRRFVGSNKGGPARTQKVVRPQDAPLLAGFVMAGILAATISSSDSYLLIAASAFAKNIYQGLFRRKASDREVLNISRITLLLIAVVAIVIALDENSVIFTIVSFAWAGFGATFGPLMLFSLFWKRTTRAGAIAGMLGGAGMVFVWNLLVRPLGGLWDIYELLPAFIFSSLCIVVVSLLTPQPSREIQREFEEVQEGR